MQRMCPFNWEVKNKAIFFLYELKSINCQGKNTVCCNKVSIYALYLELLFKFKYSKTIHMVWEIKMEG